MSGLKSRQRTMIRTRVNASSIITNSFLFPFFRAFRPRGCVYFSAFGKRARKDEGKPETENTLPQGGRLSVSPESRPGLTHRRYGLRFAGKDTRQYPRPHYRKSRFRSKEESRCRTALSKQDRRFTLLAIYRVKDPPRKIDSGAAQKSKRERRTRSPAGY